MSFETAGLNQRRSVLQSALGRVWLAFCSDEERQTILRDIGGLGARQQAALDQALQRIRQAGHAFTPPNRSSLNGMAVPVRHRERMLGCLSMRFPQSVMSEEEAATRFGKRLLLLGRSIAADVVGWRPD